MNELSENLLKKLVETHGVSGFEGEVAKIFRDELESSHVQIQKDNLGSIICSQQTIAEQKNVMLITHIDEVGFMIKSIKSDGTLSLFSLGGVNLVAAIGTKIKIIPHSAQVRRGIIIASDPKNITIDTIYVDIGCFSQEEVQQLGIMIGDQVAFDTPYERYDNIIIANSLDNRIACSIGIEVFKEISQQVNYNFFLVGSVQEEVGTRGAKTSVSLVNPDLCIVLDVASPKDSLYHKEKSRFLGKGPCLCMADKTALGDKRIINRFRNLAEEHHIPFQYDYLNGGGTDAGAIQKHGTGVSTMAVIIPVRYCHTAQGMAHVEDYKNTKSLLTKFFLSLNEEFI